MVPSQLNGNFKATSQRPCNVVLSRGEANIDSKILLLPIIHFILKLFYNRVFQ